MKARIVDKAILEAVSPTALRAYAVHEGWKKADVYGTSSVVYARPDQASKQELLIPATMEIADYAHAVSQAIQFLAKFEGRDELAIYADIVGADRDVVRVRAPDSDSDGSISIDHGVEIVQNARHLLASAACSAIEPRRAYHLGKIQKAENYMKRVRLGQTERGSFVVTILAPMLPTLSPPAQIQLWPELVEEPYERQVTRTLMQGLHAAQSAIVESNNGNGQRAFSAAVSKGVSANLCEAVAAMVDQANGIDFSVTWARTRPAPVARDVVAFSRSDAEVLREAGRQFRLHEPRRDERILGYVTHLKRDQDEADGRVTIKAIVDGQARSLSAFLRSDDYGIAVAAHSEKLPIAIVGDLEMTGNRWQLVEPRDLQVMSDADEE